MRDRNTIEYYEILSSVCGREREGERKARWVEIPLVVTSNNTGVHASPLTPMCTHRQKDTRKTHRIRVHIIILVSQRKDSSQKSLPGHNLVPPASTRARRQGNWRSWKHPGRHVVVTIRFSSGLMSGG